MKTSTSIIIAVCVLLFLPAIWGIYKIFGLNQQEMMGFWRDFIPWAAGFVFLIGSWYLINKLKKQ